jgi:hypothetical protein
MPHKDRHISDRDLLLAADSELSSHRLLEVSTHLESCEKCSERLRHLQDTSVSLSTALRDDAQGSLPDPGPARAALRQKLAEAGDVRGSSRSFAGFKHALAAKRWAYNSAIALAVVVCIAIAYRQMWLPISGGLIAQVQAAPLPRPNLTPGAARGVPTDICLAAPKEDPSAIPVAERIAVFREYGMDYRRAKDYELDHLITPALGGTDDIHNLWPEPYAATEWNAHVKDQLEDLLHQRVCSGQLDLATAQHDIATDWIAAYKKYFRTDKPLANYSALVKDADDDPLDKS